MLTLFLAAALIQIPAVPRDTAPLVIGSRAIIVFRASLGAAGPQERASAAAGRIRAALEEPGDSIAVRDTPAGALVVLNGHAVFTVTPAEADSAAGQAVPAAAAAAIDRLRVAIAEAREARSLRALLWRVVIALAATLVLMLAIRLLVAGRRKGMAALGALTTERVPRIALRGFTLLRPEQLQGVGRAALTAATWAVGLVVGYAYVTFVLTRFPWTRAWGEALGRYLIATVSRLGLGALRAVPGLFTVAVIFIATRFLSRIVRAMFEAVERGTLTLPGIHPETAQPTRRIAAALLWLFAVVVAYPYLPGSGSDAFKGVSVFAGLLITLGSAGLVGQAMSGLVVMYARAFREGDFVQVGSTQGTVVTLGMLSTRLRTTKNEYVTVPNGVLVTGTVTNFSAARDYRHPLTVYSSVTIGYDTPWRRIHALMIEAARRTEGVLEKPPPFVLQRALTDWYVEYQVNAAVDPAGAADLPAIYSRLHAAVQDAFAEAGVEIMSPTYLAVRDGNRSTLPAEGKSGARPGAGA